MPTVPYLWGNKYLFLWQILSSKGQLEGQALGANFSASQPQ